MFFDEWDDPAEPSIGELQPPWEAAHSIAGWMQWTGPDADDPGERATSPPARSRAPSAPSSTSVEIVEDDVPDEPPRYRLRAVALDRFEPWGTLRKSASE